MIVAEANYLLVLEDNNLNKDNFYLYNFLSFDAKLFRAELWNKNLTRGLREVAIWAGSLV